MLITHKNTATIGDFANTWPLLSEISKRYGPVDISLPNIYQKFLGLKEFLEYQDFINTVDLNNKMGILMYKLMPMNLYQYLNDVIIRPLKCNGILIEN